MIVDRIVQINVLPGIQHNANGRCYAKKPYALAPGAYAGVKRLQHKNYPVGAISIFASKIYIEYKIERNVKVYFVSVPYAATL